MSPVGAPLVDPGAETGAGGVETRFLPHRLAARKADSLAGWTLPPHLQEQLPRRLRAMALLYSASFFLADLAPPLVMGQMPEILRTPGAWAPAVVSILIGLAVAVVAGHPRLQWRARMHLGLAFQVVGSYGIAAAMYRGAQEMAGTPIVFHVLSPSWVAIWMIVYAVVVPAPLGRTLVALLASASAPPVIIGLALQSAGLLHLFPPGTFFRLFVFPYLICVGLAWGAARIMITLGADVSRARELGSYRLIERLGEGGMGEVWRASHRFLARQAAIKFIRPVAIAGMSAAEASPVLQRFEREAQATASLTSAHTIEVYDFGIADDGTFYYVMELLHGLDLDRFVRQFGPLPAPRVIHLLQQVCESLEEAHAKDLIHRDVKPANIYVCRSGMRRDFVKVLDFGLVVHRRAETPPDARLTSPELVLGTPSYLAPEAALGRPLDGRSDLYGLGCVAYWLLTGREVFEGASNLDVIAKHVRDAPEPPSRHAPGALPPELEAVVMRCLEKQPENRPATAGVLEKRLGAIALDDAWNEQRAEAWWSAHESSLAEAGVR